MEALRQGRPWRLGGRNAVSCFAICRHGFPCLLPVSPVIPKRLDCQNPKTLGGLQPKGLAKTAILP